MNQSPVSLSRSSSLFLFSRDGVNHGGPSVVLKTHRQSDFYLSISPSYFLAFYYANTAYRTWYYCNAPGNAARDSLTQSRTVVLCCNEHFKSSSMNTFFWRFALFASFFSMLETMNWIFPANCSHRKDTLSTQASAQN
jgi:hypothetical protein